MGIPRKMTSMKADPAIYEGVVHPEWIDYNGHMNDACYVNVFSRAIDNFMDLVGLDEACRISKKVSLYTIQTAVHYLQEIGVNEALRVRANLLEFDNKKLRLFMTMERPASGVRLAVMEVLLLSVDMAARRAAPFLPGVRDDLAALLTAQGDRAWPAEAGRGVALQRR